MGVILVQGSDAICEERAGHSQGWIREGGFRLPLGLLGRHNLIREQSPRGFYALTEVGTDLILSHEYTEEVAKDKRFDVFGYTEEVNLISSWTIDW